MRSIHVKCNTIFFIVACFIFDKILFIISLLWIVLLLLNQTALDPMAFPIVIKKKYYYLSIWMRKKHAEIFQWNVELSDTQVVRFYSPAQEESSGWTFFAIMMMSNYSDNASTTLRANGLAMFISYFLCFNIFAHCVAWNAQQLSSH